MGAPGDLPHLQGSPSQTTGRYRHHALSHEIAEWSDDPFVNNSVQPWLTPTAPQYGCTDILETGDPVVAIGFAKGTNTFEQGQIPTAHRPPTATTPPRMRRSCRGSCARRRTRSQSDQSPSSNIGRYTLMGDLNPFPGFRQPATAAQTRSQPVSSGRLAGASLPLRPSQERATVLRRRNPCKFQWQKLRKRVRSGCGAGGRRFKSCPRLGRTRHNG